VTTPPLVAVLEVFVPGRPAPQGSVRAVVHRSTQRAVVIKDNNETQKSWRTTVGWYAAQAWNDGPIGGAVSVVLQFVMPRPSTAPKRSTPAAVKRPDLDKLQRAVFDALSGIVWRDDSQVVDVHATKRLAELDETPGVHIAVAVKETV
jgi:crossover junction endodeoxyribonuclease RusA